MAHTSGLTIRQFDRAAIDLSAELIVDESQREQVRFKSTSGSTSSCSIAGRTADLSTGGAGMYSSQFVPRMCKGLLRIHSAGIESAAFEHEVLVRRLTMTSHEPTYLIGLSFVDPQPDIDSRIAEFLASADIQPSESEAGDA